MKLILIVLLTAALSCQERTTYYGPERTEAVFITGNQLPVDGCEESVRIETDTLASPIRYKPTPGSLPILRKALNTTATNSYYPGEKKVIMRFSETGRQVMLQCGWGSRSDVPEIEILAITEP